MQINREKFLDLLRFFAILGVLFRHSDIDSWYAKAGWAGVDLFFVLSGFLISNLLFKEYNRNNSVNIPRFLIRRGFKIYPSFYVMLITSIIISKFVFGSVCGINNILSEVLFMQSYFDGCYLHTWSLAVEEHFYFFLSILVYLLVRFKLLDKTKLVIPLFLSLILIVVLLRYVYVINGESIVKLRFFMSHLRCDGLLIGVFVSYLYNFLPEVFIRAKKYVLFLVLACIGLISLVFYVDTKSFFLLTIGFDLIAIGFSLLLVLNLIFKENTAYSSFFKNPIISLFALVGKYSYSIYLWHIIIAQLLNHYFKDKVPVLVYFLSAIILGMLFSVIIEQPVLKLREKLKISM